MHARIGDSESPLEVGHRGLPSRRPEIATASTGVRYPGEVKRFLFILTLFVPLAAGCGDDDVRRCNSPADCDGDRCFNGLCVPDEALPDASAEDSGQDAGMDDAAVNDAAVDASADTGGGGDAAIDDSGTQDANTEDASTEDAGAGDAAMDAEVDAGRDDAAPTCPNILGTWSVCDHPSCAAAQCYADEVEIIADSRSPFECGFRVTADGRPAGPNVAGAFGTDDGRMFEENGILVDDQSCSSISRPEDDALEITSCGGGRGCGVRLVRF